MRGPKELLTAQIPHRKEASRRERVIRGRVPILAIIRPATAMIRISPNTPSAQRKPMVDFVYPTSSKEIEKKP